MARIPKFQQRRLASSVVGTPGVDQSQQRAFASVSQAAGSAANVFGQLAAKRQKAKDDAIVNKELIILDIAQETLLREHQKENVDFEGDPQDRIQAFQNKSRKLFQQSIDGIASRNARQRFSLLGEQVIGGKLSREAKEADENQGIIAFNNTVDSVNQLALEAAELGLDTRLSLEEKRARMLTLVQLANMTVRDSKNVLSPENFIRLKESAPEAILRGAISTLVKNNPQELLVLLNDDNVKKQFDPEELAKFKADGIKNLKLAAENREIDKLIFSFQQGTEFLDKWKRGDPTILAQLQNAEGDPFLLSFSEYLINEPVDPVVSSIRQSGLMDRKSELDIAKKKKKSKKKTMKAALEDGMDFLVDATKAAQDGEITRGQYIKHLNDVLGPFYDKMKKERSGGVASLFDIMPSTFALNIAQDWFRRNNLLQDKEGLVTVMEDFESILAKQGPVTRASMSKSMGIALRNLMVTRDPRLALLSGTPNVIIDENKDLQVGLPGDDTPAEDATITAGAGVVVREGTLDDGTGRRVRITTEDGVETKRELI